jgi:hypothetical protein
LAILALGLVGWIAAAFLSNERFSIAATLSYQQTASALTAFEEARQSIARAVQSRALPQSSIPSPPSDGVEPKPATNDLIREMDRRDDLIEEIGRRAENEGDINSISARGLLMERAFLSYRNGPFFGQGLAAAYALQPHNAFLLFAIAFGHLGWLVPIAFLSLTVYWARRIQQLPLFLATLTVMSTSHDILLTPGLLAPIVFGIAGLNSMRYRASDAFDALPVGRYVAAIAPIVFAWGGVSIFATRISNFPIVPKLLLFLVFGAITLWSIGIWLWARKAYASTKLDT